MPRAPRPQARATAADPQTANLRTKILGFRRFDSSRILVLRGGIPRPTGNLPESSSQAILVVGRLGAAGARSADSPGLQEAMGLRSALKGLQICLGQIQGESLV